MLLHAYIMGPSQSLGWAPTSASHHDPFREFKKLRSALTAGKRLIGTRELPQQHTPTYQLCISFGRIRNIGAEIYGCYAGGSDDEDKSPKGVVTSSIILGQDEFDPNFNLGVMMYYVRASRRSVYMFDTSPSKVVADTCNQLLQDASGLTVSSIILSHGHQDHIGGRYATSLAALPIVAQDSLVEKFGSNLGSDVPLREGEVRTLPMHETLMNVTNVQAHTPLGTVVMLNGVALVGDELESTFNLLVSAATGEQRDRLLRSAKILQDNNINKVLPAHGSGAAIFNGYFTLGLLQSNLRYLDLMSRNPRTVCAMHPTGNMSEQLRRNLARQIGVASSNITRDYLNVHRNENCRTVGLLSRGLPGRAGR